MMPVVGSIPRDWDARLKRGANGYLRSLSMSKIGQMRSSYAIGSKAGLNLGTKA